MDGHGQIEKAGSWKLEAGSWKPEAGSRKPEATRSPPTRFPGRSTTGQPGRSRRVRRVYADVLTLLSTTQPKEAAIATCEDARKILVELGALDLSDLSATSAYGDTSDLEARHALSLGRLDDAERLQREVMGLAEKVLAQRPGDLKAMANRSAAPELLAQISVRRSDYAGALVFADDDGVVVVPRKAEAEAVQRAWEKVHAENVTRDAIKNGMKATEAWKKYGVL